MSKPMKKALVIRFKQIGDAILTAPICATLKATFPDMQVDYVLYEHVAPLFQNQKHIDNVITITEEERKNPLKYFFKLLKLRREKYDIIVDVMATPKSEIMTFVVGHAKYKIGNYHKHRGFAYTHRIHNQPDRDMVDKLIHMLEPLEAEYLVKYVHDMSIEISDDEKDAMKNKMEAAGIDFTRPIFICAINSRVPYKVYPIADMLTVIRTVKEKYKAQMIFFYSKSEKEFALEAHKALNMDKDVFTNIETASIRELGALIANCHMFIGNEGGPRHLSQAIGTPSFSVWRKTGGRDQWIPGRPDMHQGVEPEDFPEYKDTMDYPEAFKVIKPEYIIGKISEIYEKYAIKKD